jgi:hypothetical protein
MSFYDWTPRRRTNPKFELLSDDCPHSLSLFIIIFSRDVAHVINYDLPTRSIESYTHRIGMSFRYGILQYFFIFFQNRFVRANANIFFSVGRTVRTYPIRNTFLFTFNILFLSELTHTICCCCWFCLP